MQICLYTSPPVKPEKMTISISKILKNGRTTRESLEKKIINGGISRAGLRPMLRSPLNAMKEHMEV